MKKTLSVLLAAIMVVLCAVSLASCSGSGAGKYTVAVQSGTTGWSFMSGDADWGFEGFSNIKVSSFENGSLAVKDMLNGKADFVVIDDSPAKNLVASNEGIKLIDIALTTESYGIAVSKEDSALLESINKVLADNKDTAIKDIFTKYAEVNEDTVANYSGTTVPSAEYDASKEQFVIATNAAFAPFEFKVGSEYAGIDIEIAKLIADTLGQELVVMDMEFDSVVLSVGNNGVDAGMAAMTINAKRKKTVNFSDPYYNDAYQVIICKNDCTLFDNAKTGEDLVAIMKGLSK